jgi:hypothetical protein
VDGIRTLYPVFTIIGRNGHEVYIPSRDVSGETVARIASRHIEKDQGYTQTASHHTAYYKAWDIDMIT